MDANRNNNNKGKKANNNPNNPNMESESKYLPELLAEKDSLDASFTHAMKLLTAGRKKNYIYISVCLLYALNVGLFVLIEFISLVFAALLLSKC